MHISGGQSGIAMSCLARSPIVAVQGRYDGKEDARVNYKCSTMTGKKDLRKPK
jgi:hypothetical protein